MVDRELQVAQEYWAAGRTREAAVKLREIVLAKPQNPVAWYLFGIALRSLGDLAGAVEAPRRAVEQNADSFEPLNDLGVTLAMQRRLAEAVETLRRVVELHPGRAEAHNNLANALVELRRWDEAIPYLRRALELRSDLAQCTGIWAMPIKARVNRKRRPSIIEWR